MYWTEINWYCDKPYWDNIDLYWRRELELMFLTLSEESRGFYKTFSWSLSVTVWPLPLLSLSRRPEQPEMNLSNSTYSNSTMRTVGNSSLATIQMTISPQNVYLSNHLLESLDFLVSGVMISLVSSVGLIGNTLLLILLSKQVRRGWWSGSS